MILKPNCNIIVIAIWKRVKIKLSSMKNDHEMSFVHDLNIVISKRFERKSNLSKISKWNWNNINNIRRLTLRCRTKVKGLNHKSSYRVFPRITYVRKTEKCMRCTVQQDYGWSRFIRHRDSLGIIIIHVIVRYIIIENYKATRHVMRVPVGLTLHHHILSHFVHSANI